MAKKALAYLPTAHFVALKPPFIFGRPSLFKIFSLKPAPFGKLAAGLGSTNKRGISLLFSGSPTLALSSSHCSLLRLSIYPKVSCTSGKNYSFSFYCQATNECLDTHISWLTTRLMSRPGGLRYSYSLHCLQSLCSVYPLISRIDSSFFSHCGGIVSSSKFFDAQVH